MLDTDGHSLHCPRQPFMPVPSPYFEDKTLVTSFHLVLEKTHTYVYLSTYLCMILNVNFEVYGLRLT